MTADVPVQIYPKQFVGGLSSQGDEAAGSTDSTEPIHFVLQHLREAFSLN
ncbi:hypothetical protein [Neisseria meningitidis]|nr:hypothetical protein [Neisseria meningitidis]